MSELQCFEDFPCADLGGHDRRARVEPGKLLDLIARMKAASGTNIKAPPRPVQGKAKAG